MGTMNVVVQNMPENAKGFIVCRLEDGEFFYYGCYEDQERAEQVAHEIEGVIGWN